MSKPAKRACIKHVASKFGRDFDCDWQRVNAFSHCVTLTRVLFPQIISYSDTKVPVLVMECKRASVLYVYELIFLLHTSRSQSIGCELDNDCIILHRPMLKSWQAAIEVEIQKVSKGFWVLSIFALHVKL